MIKDGLIILQLRGPMLDDFFKRAGYKKHWKKDHGFIKDLFNKKRWHAYYRYGNVEIHLDRTSERNIHFAETKWDSMKSIEMKRLKKIIGEQNKAKYELIH